MQSTASWWVSFFAFTNNYDQATAILSEAAQLTSALEIADEVKTYRLAVANSLAGAALLLAGQLAEAQELHANHPMQASKERILLGGEFHTYQEFFFGVSDVILARAIKQAPDPRWRLLFEKDPKWNTGELETTNINSYRHFAIGLLDVAALNVAKGQRELMMAATERIDIFDAILKINSEGFQLPTLVDKLVLLVGAEAATELNQPDTADLLLRISEVLNRNIRHSVADAAIVIGSQPEERGRKIAHSFIHLVRQKREWELSKLKELLGGNAPFQDKGALISDYTGIVSGLASIKQLFLTDQGDQSTNGLPTVRAIQETLRNREVFVAFFQAANGCGRLCISPHTVKYSVVPFDGKKVLQDIRLLELAMTSNNPPDPTLDSQFPVASALSIYKLLFAGLEPCLVPGMNATVAVPNELAGVPFGALLDAEPKRITDGYDLVNASWLIKHFGFAGVISARQFVATARTRTLQLAGRSFLGIGDPALTSVHLAHIQSTSEFRGAFEKANGGISNFQELPETREELSVVGGLLKADKSDILVGRQATEETLRSKLLSDYDVIHFATHGLMAQDIPGLTESALLLTGADPNDSYNDGVLSASEILQFSLNARLVVLSACNSAKYDLHQASLGVRDLHAAFTLAGAPSLLASLWPIESVTARDLAVLFFEKWQSRSVPRGASEALAEATRTYLENADLAHQHPRFWASFVIVGYGGISGQPVTSPSVDTSFEPLTTQAGDVIQLRRFGSSVVVSMSSDWDGSKMASIISRRHWDGRVDWSISSREVGAGRISVNGNRIYAIGYTTEANPTPVVRAIDANGHVQWQMAYTEFQGYHFDDVTNSQDGILTIAVPRFVPAVQAWPPSRPVAFLVEIGANGSINKKIPFEADTTGLVLGRNALIQRWGSSIIVALNHGMTMRTNYFYGTLGGMPALSRWMN
jgi:CHAT domain-containing protein